MQRRTPTLLSVVANREQRLAERRQRSEGRQFGYLDKLYNCLTVCPYRPLLAAYSQWVAGYEEHMPYDHDAAVAYKKTNTPLVSDDSKKREQNV